MCSRCEWNRHYLEEHTRTVTEIHTSGHTQHFKVNPNKLWRLHSSPSHRWPENQTPFFKPSRPQTASWCLHLYLCNLISDWPRSRTWCGDEGRRKRRLVRLFFLRLCLRSLGLRQLHRKSCPLHSKAELRTCTLVTQSPERWADSWVAWMWEAGSIRK